MFYHLSNSVGSGKTQAILEYIRDNFDVGYLYVAPTIQLCDEVYRRLLGVLVNNQEAIADELIRQVVTDNQLGPVFPRASEAVKEISQRKKGVVILTEATFRYLLSELSDQEKACFKVFIDEGLSPIRSESFSPDDQRKFLKYFTQDKEGFIKPAEGCSEVIEKVAIHPKKLGEDNLDHLNIPQFRAICELVNSGNYDVFLKQSDKAVMIVGLLSPRQMLAFQSVTLIVAIFKQTLLPLFWMQRHEIEFEAFDIGQELFNTHKVKGPDISISHVLHERDNASKENLVCNFETGERQEANPKKQVIFVAAKAIDNTHPNGEFCWAANKHFKNTDNVFHGAQMPAISAGLDSFKRFDTVVSLVCINPLPWVKNALLEIFEFEDDRLYELWRLSHTYQTVGRCSLRDRKSRRKIHMIVISRRCAEQLSELFENSRIVGQVTDLPCYRDLRRNRNKDKELRRVYSAADNSAYSKYLKRCRGKKIEPYEKPIWYDKIRIQNMPPKG